MNIVFSINKLGMEGLGAALTSLVRNCSDSKQLRLWFLCSGLQLTDKENIAKLLQQENFAGDKEMIDYNAKQLFGHLRSLHGDWTVYGRLLIPQLIPGKTALYLDADIIVLKDILSLKNFSSDKALSAVVNCKVQWSLEHSFFMNTLKWKADTNYLGSGVLLFNIDQWREEKIDEKVKSVGSKYSHEFLSADQTLLNIIVEGDFGLLPGEFNAPWYPVLDNPSEQDITIVHFIGSPKPWDMFGKTIHRGYKTWDSFNTNFWRNTYGKVSVDKIKRTWEIKRSIFKCLKHRFKNAA